MAESHAKQNAADDRREEKNRRVRIENRRRGRGCPSYMTAETAPHVPLGTDVIETVKVRVYCVRTVGWHEDHPDEHHVTADGLLFPRRG